MKLSYCTFHFFFFSFYLYIFTFCSCVSFLMLLRCHPSCTLLTAKVCWHCHSGDKLSALHRPLLAGTHKDLLALISCKILIIFLQDMANILIFFPSLFASLFVPFSFLLSFILFQFNLFFLFLYIFFMYLFFTLFFFF